jgi:NADPH:quinone reductase-like Zn-dependent oxidoreductase
MEQPIVSTPATTSRAALLESFGGPEALNLREVPAPQAGPGQIRVRVTAAGLNPMDWFMTSDPETAARFGLSLPSGFGTDYAGVVDQAADGVTGFAPGDRVFGGALSRAVADYVLIDVAGTIAAGGDAHHTPQGVDDRTAATLAIAGCTAAAALAVVSPGPGDTLLIGGAGGGVGVFAVQLARLAGARVIGTGSPASAGALRALGAEPVAYGDGLAGRLRAMAPSVTAAIDLHGTETAQAARELSVPDKRITTIAAQVDGITPANGANAAPGAIEEIARLVAAGQLRVPIAASFPVEQIRAAVELQAGRHVHGKVVIDLYSRARRDAPPG